MSFLRTSLVLSVVCLAFSPLSAFGQRTDISTDRTIAGGNPVTGNYANLGIGYGASGPITVDLTGVAITGQVITIGQNTTSFYEGTAGFWAHFAGNASLFGGSMNHLYAYSSGKLNVAGGVVNYVLQSGGNSAVSMTSGNAQSVWAVENGTVNMTGGTASYFVASKGNATFNLHGGTVGAVAGRGEISVQDNSHFHVYGGSFKHIENRGNSTVTLYGQDVRLSNPRTITRNTEKFTQWDLRWIRSDGTEINTSYFSIIEDYEGKTYNPQFQFVQTQSQAFGGASAGRVAQGSFRTLTASDTAIVEVAGGSTDELKAQGSAIINVSGGSLDELFLFGDSVVNITGGNISSNTIYNLGNGTLNLSGSGLTLSSAMAGTYQTYTGTWYDLTGTLQNGDAISTRYFAASSDNLGTTFNPVVNGVAFASAVAPEPASLALFALSGFAFFRRRIR